MFSCGQKKTGDVEYVTFTVVPSSEDDKNIKNEMIDLSDRFKETNNDESFANRYSIVKDLSFDYLSSSDIADPVFSELITKLEGTVEGPYKLTNGSYRLSKLSEIVDRPDSVKARHILLTKENFTIDSAKTILKNLRNQVKNGADFGQLATQFSEGASSIWYIENGGFYANKGSDLGWFSEGQMVQEFNDVCFASSIGGLKIVTTNLAVHLIQITNVSNTSKKYKIVYFDKEVVASVQTKDNYYIQVNNFINSVNAKDDGTSFSSFAESKNLLVRKAVNVNKMQSNISGLQNSEAIIKWMFDENTKEGDISNSIYTCGDDYVVVRLLWHY
jgi:peptidyl-prolyl cis-trans isomerase D